MTTPSVPGNPSDYAGLASWTPSGTWILKGGQSYQLPASAWLSTSDSDPNTAQKIGQAVMETNGNILVPYSSTYIMNVNYDLSDFIAAPTTTDLITIVFTYVPGSQAQSPQFVLGTIKLTAAAPHGSFSQRTIMHQGDQISITVTSKNDVSNPQVGTVTSYSFVDDSSDTNLQLYAGVSGSPPVYNNINKISYMTSGVVSGGKGLCTFTCTQDGTPTGQSIFQGGITGVWSIAQASSNISAVTDGATVTLNPYPSDLKTVTCVLTQTGGTIGAFVADGYKVNARIDGY